jgi:drug/metabolite transporter (DMT)-like permease
VIYRVLAFAPAAVWLLMMLIGPDGLTDAAVRADLARPFSPADHTLRVAWLLMAALAVVLLALAVVVSRALRGRPRPPMPTLAVLCWVMAALTAFQLHYKFAWAAAHSDAWDWERWWFSAVSLALFTAAAVSVTFARAGSAR